MAPTSTARPTTWAAGNSPPGRKVIFTSGTALTGTQIKDLQITQPNGPGESRKVAGVVDAMDGGKSTAVPLDLVNAGGTEI